MQLPLELLAPLSDRHVSQSPDPSQLPSEMARHEASLPQADSAAALVLYVRISLASLQYRPEIRVQDENGVDEEEV